MRWTVVWVRSASDELARLWMRGPDRQAIADAANRIDRDLRLYADTLGQSINDDRIYTDPPLVVTFIVHPDDCLVEVIQVERL